MVFTISIQESENGWLAGQCEQLPEVISQGKGMDDLMKNIYRAAEETLEMRQIEKTILSRPHFCPNGGIGRRATFRV